MKSTPNLLASLAYKELMDILKKTIRRVNLMLTETQKRGYSQASPELKGRVSF